MNINTQSRYFEKALTEHRAWYREMNKSPSLLNTATRGIQRRINQYVPEAIHKAITGAIREITRAVISGSVLTTSEHLAEDLEKVEIHARQRIRFYTNSSAAEGAVTGFGGFISGLADFPLWLTLKMKMLFEIGQAYGMDVSDYRERLYILHIFQLTFSPQKHRQELIQFMSDWENNKEKLPADIKDFDWRTFQLEYRDYIDLAKLIQLIPGFGAIAGAVVNHQYTKKLGENAMNAYRLRYEEFRN